MTPMIHSLTTTNNKGGHTTKVKCVLFDLEPHIHTLPTTIPSNDDDHHDDIWYSPADIQTMKAAAVNQHDRAYHEHDFGLERRVLARYTVLGSKRRDMRRVQVVAAVLRAQKNKNHHNHTAIRQASIQYSQSCQQVAQVQGYNDEVEAHGDMAQDAYEPTAETPSIMEEVRFQKDLLFLKRCKKRKQQQQQQQQQQQPARNQHLGNTKWLSFAKG